MKVYFVVMLTFVSFIAKAQHSFPMAKNTPIKINSYDPTSKTFDITAIQYPGQGPLTTTAEELSKAIHGLRLKRLERNPSSVVDLQFTTNKKMILLPPTLVEARKISKK